MAFAARPIDKPEELNKGRVAASKVHRYRPGQAPAWAQQPQGSDEEDNAAQVASPSDNQAVVMSTDVAAPVIIARPDDPRLARLAQQSGRGRRRRGSSDEESSEDDNAGPSAPRIIRRGSRPTSDAGTSGAGDDGDEEEEEEEEEEEDDEAMEQRRAALRARLQAQAAAAEAAAADNAQLGEEEEEEEGSSEWETDSEDEDGPGHTMMKPVFVPKTDRETIVEREALEHEYEIQQEKAKARVEERKVETRQLVVEIINAEAAAAAAATEEAKTALDAIDTDDEAADADEEFEAWKARELARIKRGRDAAKQEQEEEAERARWNALSDEQKAREKAQDAAAAPGNKKKWRFMQKYWHKGAFFQDDADDAFASTKRLDVLDRDYSAPTGEDKFDRTMLPKVMQVKNFGRRGQTKWTHLKAEDTTDFEAPWVQNEALRAKLEKKMAGTGSLDKPKQR